MAIMQRFFGGSPFPLLLEHTKKVHECVELIRPIAEALVNGEHDKIEELHHRMSATEHEADQIKNAVRKRLYEVHLLSVGRYELLHFLTYQDNVADAAEDFAVVALLRKTQVPAPVKDDFLAFVDQVIYVSNHLLNLAEELTVLAESAFTGKEAENVLAGINDIGEEEWKADKLQRRFARKSYDLEGTIDPITLVFLDKYCKNLSAIANGAEKAGKYLRQIIGSA